VHDKKEQNLYISYDFYIHYAEIRHAKQLLYKT